MKYLTLTVLIILFVLEFVIFPPLSAQIKHGTYTYQDSINDYFDNQANKQTVIEQNTIEQYKSTTIKAIRENPEDYIGKQVSINGQLDSISLFKGYYRSDISEFFDTVIIDKNDYIIYLDRNYYFSSKINKKGEPVKPVFNAWDDPCMVTIKGEIKYIHVEHAVERVTTELLVIVPHEIIYDGLIWTIHTPTPTPTPTPTTIPTRQGVTILV